MAFRRDSARRNGKVSLLSGLITVAVTLLSAGAAMVLFANVLPTSMGARTEAAALQLQTSLEIAWLRLKAVTDRSNPPAP
jgi:hypothetical protein